MTRIQQHVDDQHAHAGIATREACSLEDQNQSDDRIVEQRANAHCMRADQIGLQQFQRMVGNMRTRELAKTSVDTVGRDAAGDHGLRSLRASLPRPLRQLETG